LEKALESESRAFFVFFTIFFLKKFGVKNLFSSFFISQFYDQKPYKKQFFKLKSVK